VTPYGAYQRKQLVQRGTPESGLEPGRSSGRPAVLSFRDVEEQLLAERGVDVDHVNVYRWVQRFTPEFVEAARQRRHCPGERWFVDETYVKVADRRTYLYLAIAQHGQVIDVWLSRRRDRASACTSAATWQS
jgi:transposase-like protein